MAEDQAVMTTEQVVDAAESPAYEVSLDAGAALDANVDEAAAAVEAAEESGAPQSEIDRLKADLKKAKDQIAGYRGRVKEEVRKETEALSRELAEMKSLLSRQQQENAKRQMEAQQAQQQTVIQRAFNDKLTELVNLGFGDAEAQQMARQFAGIVQREMQLEAMQVQLSEQKSVNDVADSNAKRNALIEDEIDAYAARLDKRFGVKVDISARRVQREIDTRYKDRKVIGPVEVVRVVQDLMDELADEQLKGSKQTAAQRAAQREARREEARATGSQQFEAGGSPTLSAREVFKRYGAGDPSITHKQAQEAERTLRAQGLFV